MGPADYLDRIARHEARQKMLNSTERTVLDMLLYGDHKVLATLRHQSVDVEVESREPAKTGVKTCFNVLESSPRLEHQELFQIADVCADISELQQPAIFILWIENGALKVLETVVFDGDVIYFL